MRIGPRNALADFSRSTAGCERASAEMHHAGDPDAPSPGDARVTPGTSLSPSHRSASYGLFVRWKVREG